MILLCHLKFILSRDVNKIIENSEWCMSRCSPSKFATIKSFLKDSHHWTTKLDSTTTLGLKCFDFTDQMFK